MTCLGDGSFVATAETAEGMFGSKLLLLHFDLVFELMFVADSQFTEELHCSCRGNISLNQE